MNSEDENHWNRYTCVINLIVLLDKMVHNGNAFPW